MSNKLMLTILSLLVLATGLSAQTAFSVSIPFSFTADDHKFPAGTYAVEADRANGVVLLRGENQDARFMLANREELSEAPRKSKLVFQRYGSQFVLKAVRGQGNWEAQSWPTGKIERELAKAEQSQQLIMVQAGSR
jgi:hypothetical protein